MNYRTHLHLLRNVDVSCDSYYDPVHDNFTPRKTIVTATFAVTWPNGLPCSLVEIFLVHKFRSGATVREDGGSLRATAAKLTHLIRYCWEKQLDFWELEDDNIYELITILINEKNKKKPITLVRDKNTVRAIIASIIDFLIWLQNEILVGVPLVGPSPEFRIRLIERRVFNGRHNAYTVQLVYHRLPPRDIKRPKRPMAREKRNALWAAISRLSSNATTFPSWARGRDFGPMLSTYLKARRELLLELLEATGARPGELSRLSVSKNEECDKTHCLILQTLKRRRHEERKIPLQPGIALRLAVFIKKHRADLLKAIRDSRFTAAPLDRVFLSIQGNPSSERVLGTEFNRLSKAAGLRNYQSCMSMFRHRFITKQVAIHLEFYLRAEGKTRELMTDSDYRTILKKVAVITGHASELSLLHYIDLAWDELGFGNQIDKFIAIDSTIESTTTQLISILASLEKQNSKKPSKLLRAAIEDILTLKNELSQAPKLKPRSD